VAAQLSLESRPRARAEPSLRVAIAGLGPKGLFALERLLDHASALDPQVRIEIDVFEPHASPGAGRVYDPGQPEYLRMNFAASQLDMWWPSSRAVPRSARRSFVDWRGEDDDEQYPPRAQVGRYLCDGLEILRRHAPPNVILRVRPCAVETAHLDGRRWIIGSGSATHAYDEVLIAIGHGSAPFPFEQLSRERIAPGTTVAMRGFALTFIDAALALTEGRGGSFEPLDHPFRLRYLPGKDDPRLIVPFTRTGRPMLAKPASSRIADRPGLGRIAAAGRAQIADIGGVVDLHDDLLPILAATTRKNLAAATGEDADGSLRATVVRWLAEAAGGVAGSGELDAVRAIEQSLLFGAGIATPDAAWALGHTWRSLYPALVGRLGGDGLSARDWPAFLCLARELERVAFGPPPLNAAKLLALVDAGRIELGYLRGATLSGEIGRIVLQSARGRREVDAVVDAVLPGPGAQEGDLLGALVEGGYARVLEGRRGLDVTAGGRCRGRDGSITPGLSAIGRPTEDSVIGNDTLSRALHPHADRWAQRVVQRSRARSISAAQGDLRQTAPA
jgi:uncharacterized NAD(P)/FAD-binding protein YdhS